MKTVKNLCNNDSDVLNKSNISTHFAVNKKIRLLYNCINDITLSFTMNVPSRNPADEWKNNRQSMILTCFTVPIKISSCAVHYP